MQNEQYNNNIFINCSFDISFQEKFHSIVYIILRCGFLPHCALEHDDASEVRMEKLYRLIETCRYGIHDISNTSLDIDNQFPRFNMPFELGLFLAAKRFGDIIQKKKSLLILEGIKYSSKIFLSDLNGVDPKPHEHNTDKLIQHVRTWIAVSSKRKLPGHLKIQKEFYHFEKQILPGVLAEIGLEMVNLSFVDYCLFIKEYLVEIAI